MKIDKMADVFLNLANFAQHALLTLYTKAFDQWCQKLPEHLSFNIKYCDLHLKDARSKRVNIKE